VSRLEAEMRAAAANLEFEKAAALRDQIKTLRQPGLALAGVEAPGA
jgi:excinuclease UvrABC nuclease subunit